MTEVPNISSIIDLQPGYTYRHLKIEIFKVKLGQSKSASLLQCIAFPVLFRKLFIDFRHFWVFVFYHRTYWKTRNLWKVSFLWFFEVRFFPDVICRCLKNSLEKQHLEPICEQLKESCRLLHFTTSNTREVPELVDNAKNNYYDKLGNKLPNPSTSSKTY